MRLYHPSFGGNSATMLSILDLYAFFNIEQMFNIKKSGKVQDRKHGYGVEAFPSQLSNKKALETTEPTGVLVLVDE